MKINIKFRNVLALTALASAMLAFSPLAHAAIITWTLEDVTFANGETASGSFEVDTSVPELFSWNFTFGGIPSGYPTSLVGTEAQLIACAAEFPPNGLGPGCDGGVGFAVSFDNISIFAYPDGNAVDAPFVAATLSGSIPLTTVGNIVDPLIQVACDPSAPTVPCSEFTYGHVDFPPFPVFDLISGDLVQGTSPPAPEPSASLLLGTGLLGILALAKRSKRHAPPT